MKIFDVKKKSKTSSSSPSVDAPVVTAISDSVAVMAGSPLTLTCSAEGNPEVLITWSFSTADGHSLPLGRGPELVLPAVSLSQAGRYDCKAENTEGKQRAAVEVKVHGEYPKILVLLKLLMKVGTGTGTGSMNSINLL